MSNVITLTGVGNIHTDPEGRFSLNDLHKAAGGNPNHRPGEFLRNQQAQELVAELTDAGNPASPIESIKGGTKQGTYVCKELVYAYAMWISAKFHLQVIRAFDALVTGDVEKAKQVAGNRQDNTQLSVAAHMNAFKVGFSVLRSIKGVDQCLLATQGLKLVQDGTGILIHDYLRVALPSPEPKRVPELNATAIGKRYNMKATQVNALLEDLGLIERNGKNTPLLTAEGALLGAMVPYTNGGHSGYQPLFFREVFDVLDAVIARQA